MSDSTMYRAGPHYWIVYASQEVNKINTFFECFSLHFRFSLMISVYRDVHNATKSHQKVSKFDNYPFKMKKYALLHTPCNCQCRPKTKTFHVLFVSELTITHCDKVYFSFNSFFPLYSLNTSHLSLCKNIAFDIMLVSIRLSIAFVVFTGCVCYGNWVYHISRSFVK